MKIAAAFLALAMTAGPAAAQAEKNDKPVVTVQTALQMLGALRSLDGHPVLSKDGTVINVPWTFSNGGLRLTIAGDIAALSLVESDYNKSMASIRDEIFKGQPPRDNTPELAEFNRQHNQIMMEKASPAALDRLQRIKASDLRLDANEIPASTIAALDAIIDR